MSQINTSDKITLVISKREVEILKMISLEYTTNDIARILYLSPHTIISHRKNMMIKMEVRNTAGLVRRGFEWKILTC